MFSVRFCTILICLGLIPAQGATAQQLSYASNSDDYAAYGVEIKYPSSKDFAASVQSLIGPENLGRLRYLLQFCLLLKNNGSKEIMMTTLRFQSTRGDEPPAHQVIQLNGGTASDGTQKNITPGSTYILGPTTLVTRAMAVAMTRAMPSAEATPTITDVANRFQTFDKSAMSLDSIVFSDGTVVGPDLFGVVHQNAEQTRAKRDVLQLAKTLWDDPPALETALRPLANLSRGGDVTAGVRQHYRITQRAMAEFVLFRRTNSPSLSFETVEKSVPLGPAYQRASGR
ncbi:MAG: hypothetical protein IT168_22655 [Bryobacterales bacterium]|nr:hypothetical protein [Bryobacterales bacterium]